VCRKVEREERIFVELKTIEDRPEMFIASIGKEKK
jgi:hypothetical protein